MYSHIRWMIRRDMLEAMAIDKASYEYPLTEEEFLKMMSQRNCIGLVAEVRDKVIGFVIYQIHTKLITICRMAVYPQYRRKRVGALMLAKIISKLTPKRRVLKVTVNERSLETHLFLKECGLTAVEVNKGICPDGGDAYTFIWVRQEESINQL